MPLRTQSKLSRSHALKLFNFGEPECLSAQFRYYTNQQALASDLEDENCAASLETEKGPIRLFTDGAAG